MLNSVRLKSVQGIGVNALGHTTSHKVELQTIE